jgi:hypothetical protein
MAQELNDKYNPPNGTISTNQPGLIAIPPHFIVKAN